MTPLTDAALRHLQDVVADAGPDGGRYQLLEVIGEGGMGTVYRARDAELERDVAVKVLRLQSDPEWLGRFRQEARVIAALEHPGIVPVHDAGILPDGRAFYVMTLVRGSRLDTHLAGLALREERLRLLLRVMEPVRFAHSRGIVHRDLTPANVMVGPFGEVLVMDWGLARPGGGSASGMVAGTPGFMAPEQARGDAGAIGPGADVFSLGAMLGVAMSGMGPVPRALRAIAERATAADPAVRYPGVAELSAELSRFLAGDPVLAYPESLRERLLRLAGRYRTPLVLMLAYLVMRLVLLLIDRR